MDVLSGVVPNAKLTDFRPAMLFDIWKSKKDGISRQGIFEHNSSSQVLQPPLWIADTSCYNKLVKTKYDLGNPMETSPSSIGFPPLTYPRDRSMEAPGIGCSA